MSERERQGRKRGRDGEKERVKDRGKRGKITNTNQFQRERQG